MRNLRMFKELCGGESLSSVILATTLWRKGIEHFGRQRLGELKSIPEFWGSMVSRGSKVYRHDDSKESALRIVSDLIERKTRVVLDIQHQMVDQKMALKDTAAWRALQEALLEEYEKDLHYLKQRLENALRSINIEWEQTFAGLQHERAKILDLERGRDVLRFKRGELHQQMDIKKFKAEEFEVHRMRLELEKSIEEECEIYSQRLARNEQQYLSSRERLWEARFMQLTMDSQEQLDKEAIHKHYEQVPEPVARTTEGQEAVVDQQKHIETIAGLATDSVIPPALATFHGTQEMQSFTPPNIGKSSLDLEDAEPGPIIVDVNARLESDSGYGSSLKDVVFAVSTKITKSSLADAEELQEEKTGVSSPTAQKESSGESAKNRSLQEYDPGHDIRSIISDKDELYSHEPARRSDQEITAEEHLGLLLAQNDKLRPLWVEALTRMEEERFVNNLRRLLKIFYLDLLQDAKTNLQQVTVRLLRQRWSRMSIARQILGLLKPSSAQLGALPKQDFQVPEDKLLRLESWIAGNAVLTPQASEAEPEVPLDGSDRDSDISSDENGTTEEATTTQQFPNISEMEEFLLKGNSFETLLVNLRVFLLPTALIPLIRVISSISNERIWFSAEEDLSLANRMKSF